MKPEEKHEGNHGLLSGRKEGPGQRFSVSTHLVHAKPWTCPGTGKGRRRKRERDRGGWKEDF